MKLPQTFRTTRYVDPHCVYSYFEKGCQKKVHVTILKGIVGDFESTVLQKNLKEWHERP